MENFWVVREAVILQWIISPLVFIGNWKATGWCSCHRCSDCSSGGTWGIFSIYVLFKIFVSLHLFLNVVKLLVNQLYDQCFPTKLWRNCDIVRWFSLESSLSTIKKLVKFPFLLFYEIHEYKSYFWLDLYISSIFSVP